STNFAFYAESPVNKSAGNFGAIVLPAAPDENGTSAASEKSRLATVPSRSLRLPADEKAGERATLDEKIASVQQEDQDQPKKLSVLAGNATGKTQTDALQAGRIVSDQIAHEPDAEIAKRSQLYFEKKREL